MNWRILTLGALFSLSAAGCGKNNPPATTTAPTPPTVTPPATTAPAPTAPTAPAMSMPAASMPAMSMPAMSMPAATAPASATAAASTLTATADKLLADATQAIKDKKWDIADAAVTQLDNYKPSLPAEYGPRIDQLKTALNAAKALTQPGIPRL